MDESSTPMPLPRRVLTAPQQISSTIKAWILDGSLRPGDRLPPEHELADLFGVSRPTVRVALQELCATQVLVVQRGRNGGHRVAEFSALRLEPSLAEFITLSLAVKTLGYEQLFEVRQALELLVAGTAAERRTPEQLARLEEALAKLEPLPTDPAAVVDLDIALHHALAECTQNPLLVSFESAMSVAMHRFAPDLQGVLPEKVVGGLADLVAAVRAGDPDAARVAMAEHLVYSADHFGVGAPAAPAA